MNADAIIERLEKLETWWADLGDDQDVLVVRKSDLDAAIADIRGYLQEPVTVYVCEDKRSGDRGLFASEASAQAWVDVNRASRYWSKCELVLGGVSCQ